ncbi:hypothetical protein D3C73_1094170 [compost metagenome]
MDLRDIHGHGNDLAALLLPGFYLGTGRAEHPLLQRNNKSRFLRQRNELQGRNHAQNRMLPAHQRFKTNDFTAADIDFGLVEQPDLVIVQRLLQIILQNNPLQTGLIAFRIIELVLGTAVLLGAVHCGIGVLHQRVGIQSVLRKAGNSYRNRQFDRMVAYLKGM